MCDLEKGRGMRVKFFRGLSIVAGICFFVLVSGVVMAETRSTLFRASGTSAVYVITRNGYRYHIPTPSVFQGYGFKWNQVKLTSQKGLARYPETRLVRSAGSPNIYYLEQGKKRLITSPTAFRRLGFDWRAVHTISNHDLASYSNGDALTVISPIPLAPIATRSSGVCNGTVSPVIDPATTYVVVGRKMFTEALQRFLQSKRAEGVQVAYYNLDELLCAFDGRDIPETLRNFLKYATERAPVRYLLLVGSPRRSQDPSEHAPRTLSEPWEMPIRYVGGIAKAGEETILSIPTDQYYASLQGNWDNNGNNVFGEYLAASDTFEFSMQPDLFVGRVPANTAEAVAAWVKKTIAWQPKTDPVHSYFRTSYCLTPNYPRNADGTPKLPWGLDKTHDIRFHYCTTDAGGDIAELANRDGADFVSTFSHGDYYGVVKDRSPRGYELNKQSPGFRKPPILFVHGCNVGGLDYPEPSLAEHLMARPDGTTAVIASTRSHWDILFRFWDEIFFHHNERIGEAVYQYKLRRSQVASLDYHELKNLFMFQLYGDPALQLVKPAITLGMPADVRFDGRDTRAITFSVTNNTAEIVSGRLVEPLHDGLARVCADFPERIAECASVALPPHATTQITRTTYLTRVPLDAGVFTTFLFEPTTRGRAIWGAASLLAYHSYTLTCGRVDDLGGAWRIYAKAVGTFPAGRQELAVSIRPGGYYDLDAARQATGDDPRVMVYQTTVDLTGQPEPVLTVPKIASRDDRGQHPDAPAIAPLVRIETRADGKLTGECEAFLPE